MIQSVISWFGLPIKNRRWNAISNQLPNMLGDLWMRNKIGNELKLKIFSSVNKPKERNWQR